MHIKENFCPHKYKTLRQTYARHIPGIQTEHFQLNILTDPLFFKFFKTKNISPQNTDLMTYINTKFVYIKNRFKSSMTTLYTDLLHKQCELERKVLLHKLSLATNSLSEFAYAMVEGPGFTAIQADEQSRWKLYRKMFAPKKRTLQKYGTEIDCNHLLPSAFYLDGEYSRDKDIRIILCSPNIFIILGALTYFRGHNMNEYKTYKFL
ncbi:Uncharacterized protein FWK35_00024343 [Aphis craccivora]|uniref:Uncharacterized protein n=1 Tax=Aphis craccivora TaxID=307492 RepID=A0A6G0VWA5_APHCR|nr:Uncharacterized protein FWK35_00024343 [Aphis craccivora]